MVATFYVYSQVQSHQFINFDDDLYITNNINVQAGLTSKSYIWAFTTSHPPYWHPVTWLSHMLDYEMYGLHAKGHHLTSLFFHIANVLILFIVLSRMTGELWKSGLVAAMFAFHPLNIESVAWIAERKNILSTLFFLLTIWAYVCYVHTSTLKRYGLVVLFFTLGLMSKPMLVTLPFVLLLLDYWPLKRLKVWHENDHNETSEIKAAINPNALKLLIEKIPLFLLSIALSITTVYFQKIAGAVQSLDRFPFQTRLVNSMVSYIKYLGKMLWPTELSILYPHPGNALPVWQGIFCCFALIGITIISIRLINKAPYFAIGWFWYMGTLIPVIGIVQVGLQAMADRFTYIPQIGIFIIIAWGAPELLSRWRQKKKVLSASGGIIILALLTTTSNQLSRWKNSITIFQHAIEVTDKKYPDFGIAYNNLAIAQFGEQKIKEAIYNLKMAIQLRPKDFKAHQNLGVALFTDQKIRESIYHYNKAIELNPNYAKSFFNLGKAQMQQGKIKKAIHNFRKTLKLKPNHAKAKNSLKLALLRWQETQ
jgi:protein O-mannosyl-transferase